MVVNALTKRHIASWLLLAVYVPMLLIASLHVHGADESGEPTCAECVQHHCNGHLSQVTTGMHPCLLCQLMTLTYVSPDGETAVWRQPQSKVFYAWNCEIPCRLAHDVVSLRAPPVV